MKNQTTYQHWQCPIDDENILWLTINRQDASVNSLNQAVFAELDDILTQLTHQPLPQGIVLLSGKSKGFIAGADIKQFTQINDKKSAFELIRAAQIILKKLAELPIPTVAMIRGFCLGGGLEMALACRYRLAEDSPATVLGLPEVNLGLHPGWGGTVRLPRLIGAPQAMSMMLAGKPVSARRAGKLGLVDSVVPERELRRAARYYIVNKPPPHRPRGWARWSNDCWVRPLLSVLFKRKLREKVNPSHYPAPWAIIDNWRRDGAAGEKAYLHEADSIAELMMGTTSRQLVRVFFLQEQLKALAKNIAGELTLIGFANVQDIQVHVVGAGVMGGDIAAWCAYKGFNVTLQDNNPQSIAAAISRAYQMLAHKIEYQPLLQAAKDRLQPDIRGLGVGRADIVIEAAFEDLAVKRQILSDLLPKVSASALLATNTSSLNLEEIATNILEPGRLLGLHFFNPVAKMPLVEIVITPQTDPRQVQMAASFVNQLGHYPLPVKNSPGFLVNRILMPYLLEAMILLEEKVAMETIDGAAKKFGMPMGPIELADAVGLDICLSVANNLGRYYGLTTPAILERQVKRGYLGLKTKHGFYSYTPAGKRVTAGSKAAPNSEIIDRLILRLCNEAVACLSEKVVESADELDAGMIYGTGFAPFRGGPIQYIRTQGVQKLYERLEQLHQRYGERFKPHPYFNLGVK